MNLSPVASFVRARFRFAVFVALCCETVLCAVAADVTMNNPIGAPTGGGSWSVSDRQLLAARFTLTTAGRITAANAEFSSSSGTFFVAIVALPSMSALPGGTTAQDVPFSTGEVVSAVTFSGTGAGVKSIPLAYDAAPGVYGVVFGSGLFGTSGTAGMPPYGPVTGSASFFRSGPVGGPFAWHNSTSSQFNIGIVVSTGTSAAPVITLHPNSVATAAITGNTTFRVAATGTPAPTFRWQRQPSSGGGFSDVVNGSILTGAATDTLTVTGPLLAMSGEQFRCVATNSAGGATSNAATLTVLEAPVITSLPAATFVAGQPGQFTLTATGSPTVDFSVNSGTFPAWASLNSVTGVISGTPTSTAGSPFVFNIRAGNAYQSAFQNFTLTVQPAATTPVITLQPTSSSQVIGGNATFSAAASGDPAPSYQWQRQAAGTSGFSALPATAPYFGTTTPSLYIAGVSSAMHGDQFRLVAYNVNGSAISVSAALNVLTTGLIATHPVSQTVTAGQPVSFAVVATGSGAFSYQWRRNGVFIPGATNAIYTITATQRADADLYSVEVGTGGLIAVSNSARLVVAPTSYPGVVGADPAFSVKVEADGAAVNALVPLADGRVLAAGDFVRFNGLLSSGVVRLSSAGVVDPTFVAPYFDNVVRCLVVQADGKILVGGDFVRVGNYDRPAVARLNADGSIDPTFKLIDSSGNPLSPPAAHALAVAADGKLFVGGFGPILRYDANGVYDPTFVAAASGVGPKLSLAVTATGKLLVGGFVQISGLPSLRYLTRLNANGTLDTTFDAANLNGFISAIVPLTDGKVYVGGSFSTYGGVSSASFLRLTSDGTRDTSFNPVLALGFQNQAAHALALDANAKLYVATLAGVARHDAAGALEAVLPGFTVSTTSSSPVLSALLPRSDDSLWVGGSFVMIGSTPAETLGRYSSGGTSVSAIGTAVNRRGSVSALIPDATGRVIIGGEFRMVNGVSAVRFARLTATAAIDSTFGVGSGPSLPFKKVIRLADGRLLVVGGFQSFSGVSRPLVAMLLANGAVDPTFTYQPASSLSFAEGAVAAPDGRVLMYGMFYNADNSTYTQIQRLLPNGTVDPSFNAGYGPDNGSVLGLSMQPDGRVVVVGGFTTFAGVGKNRVLRLLPDGAVDASFATGTGFDASLPANANAISLVQLTPANRLVFGGYFTSFNGSGVSAVVRLNGGGTLDSTFAAPSAQFASGVAGLLVQDDERVLAWVGRDGFTSATAVRRLVRLDASGAIDPSFQLNDVLNTDHISALAMGDAGQLYYSIYNRGEVYRSLPQRAITTQPQDASVVTGQTATFSISAVGNGPVSYQWRRNGISITGATGSSYAIAAASRSAADYYDVVATDSVGSTVSNTVRLSVAPSSYPGYVAPDPAWELRPEVDGATVTAMLPLPDGRTYVAGLLTSVDGQRRMGVFRLAADQTLDPGFVPAEVDNAIGALAIQTDGKLLIGGAFLRIDGLPRPRVARLNPDGTIDPTFNPGSKGPDSTVNSILVQADRKIVITGPFSTYNAQPVGGVARLTPDGALDIPAAQPLVLTGTGISLAPLSGGRVAIGGNFTAVNGTPRAGVVVVNSDLAVDPSFNTGSSYWGNVNIVIPQADGRLLIGGTFSSVNGVARQRIARLNTDGSVDTGFDIGATFNGTVSSLALTPAGKIVAGGWFSSGGATTGVALGLNADGTTDGSFTGPVYNNAVNVVQVGADSRVLTGGSYTLAGSTSRRALSRLNSSGGLDAGFAPDLRAGGTIAAFAPLPDGKILLAHSFQYVRGAAVPGRLVRANADGTIDPTFNPGGSGANSVIHAIVRQPDGRILIAGSFSAYNGTVTSRVARLNADGTLDPSFLAPALDGGVFVLTLLPGGRTLIGGTFQTVGGLTRPWLAALFSWGGYDPAFDPGTINGAVMSAALQPDGKVVVGGSFDTAGGASSPRLARLNANGSADSGFNVGSGPNSSVAGIVLQPDGRIVIGGGFTTVNGVVRSAVARLEGSGSLDPTFVSAAAGFAGALLGQEDGRLLVRGQFTTINGSATNASLVRLTANGSLDPTFVATGFASLNFSPAALAMRDDGKLFLPTSAPVGFAVTRPATPPAIVTPPAPQTVLAGTTVTFSVGATGNAPAFYQWTRDSIPVAGGNYPTLTLTGVTPAQAGVYALTISNELGTVTSSGAGLAVTPLSIAPLANRSVGVGGLTAFGAVTNIPPPLTYQWRRDGAVLGGATGATLVLSPVAAGDAGAYTVTAVGALGSVTSTPGVLTVLPNPIAYSVRQVVGLSGISAFFSIDGTQPKRILLRAVGPTLATFGISGCLGDPQISVEDAQRRTVAANDNWGDFPGVDFTALFFRLGAFPLPTGSRDAAVYATLPPGSYSVRVNGVDSATGVALLELFDADTNPASRLAYVGLRGRVDGTAGSLTGGLTMTNSANKRLLLRAVGPTLGGAGAHANPLLRIMDGSTTVAENDDWGGTAALRDAAVQAGAFALPDASADAAVLLEQRVGSGSYTAQVPTGADAGEVLLEFYDLPASGPSNVAPLIVVPPASQSAAVGADVTLRALAVGSGPPALQWRKNGGILAGNTATSLTLPAVRSADAGRYELVAGSGLGTAVSSPAHVTIGVGASHALVGVGYAPGGTVTISNTLSFTEVVAGLGWEVSLPSGWSFVSDSGGVGDIRPRAGDSGTLSWAWSTVPVSPVTFSYTVNVPAGSVGTKAVAAVALVRQGDAEVQTAASPAPLVVNQVFWHDADTSRDWRLSLSELLRVIQIFNTRNGTVRTGCYAVQAGSEDGFAPEPLRSPTELVTLPRYHSADTNRDGKFSLSELLRVIQIFNYRSGTVRTGEYHLQPGTEDGYAPGP